MKLPYLWIMVAILAMTSCSSHDDAEVVEPEIPPQQEEAVSVEVQFVVSDYPAFAYQDETIGDDKTAWCDADEIFVTFTSHSKGTKNAVLTYRGNVWTTDVNFSYIEGEIPEVTALYAPCYKFVDGTPVLKPNSQLGLSEYILVQVAVNGDKANICFTDASRTYSRLCINTIAEQTLTVTTTGFTPAGTNTEVTETYTIQTDAQGFVYLYGSFSEGATVKVESDGVLWTNYTFSSPTKAGENYKLVVQPPVIGQSIVFVEGVSRESGWYDVNKVGKGENGDINMCWAASASNIIEWWQDRYVAAGNVLPDQAVKGPGQTYELALMEVFHQQWNNNRGGQVAEAVPWYFEGVNYGVTASPGSQAYPLSDSSGGYFKDDWNAIYSHLYHEYTYMLGTYTGLYVGEFNNYYLWGNGSELLGEDRLRYFTQLVVQFVERGIASLTVSLSSNLQTLHHATTIWGYEIDHSSGLLTRLWITDSDDLEVEPKASLLNEYVVSISEGKSHIKLSSNEVRYGACYVVALTPVSGYKK